MHNTIHPVQCSSASKRKDVPTPATAWRDLGDAAARGEIRRPQRQTVCEVTCTRCPEPSDPQGRERHGGCRGLGRVGRKSFHGGPMGKL